MADKFKCKVEKLHCCFHICDSWKHCNKTDIGSYGAPCPYCMASSPLNNKQCNNCIHKEWKQENYRK